MVLKSLAGLFGSASTVTPLIAVALLDTVAADAPDSLAIVRRGETLTSVASRVALASSHDNVRDVIAWIRQHNELDGGRLIPGQTLRVPFSRAQIQPVDPLRDARGIYLNATVAGGRKALKLADELLRAGGNTIVLDIKDRAGTLSYMSAVPLAVSSQAGSMAAIRNPELLVELLHQRGIHVVARLTCFYDRHLARTHPELLPRSREGGLWPKERRRGWLDPSLPIVWDYLIGLAQEVAAMGVDEIQLDYVRFPTDRDVEDAVFAYDPAEQATYDVITGFVAAMRQSLPTVLLSADIFGVVVWGRDEDERRTGQRLPDLLPLLDVVSPMVYPSHFNADFHSVDNPPDYPYFMVRQACQRLLPQAASHGVAVRPWVQAFSYRIPQFDNTFVEEQLRGVEDSGVQGWMLWNPASRYAVGFEAIRRVVSGNAPDPTVVQARNPPGQLVD